MKVGFHDETDIFNGNLIFATFWNDEGYCLGPSNERTMDEGEILNS